IPSPSASTARSAAARAAGSRARARGERQGDRATRGPGARPLAEPGRLRSDLRAPRAVPAELAPAAPRGRPPEGERAQVADVTQEVDRLLRVARLQLGIGRTHPAHALELAARALRDPGDPLVADPGQELIPALAQRSAAQVEGVPVREHADAHPPLGIDGA